MSRSTGKIARSYFFSKSLEISRWHSPPAPLIQSFTGDGFRVHLKLASAVYSEPEADTEGEDRATSTAWVGGARPTVRCSVQRALGQRVDINLDQSRASAGKRRQCVPLEAFGGSVAKELQLPRSRHTCLADADRMILQQPGKGIGRIKGGNHFVHRPRLFDAG